MTIRQNILAKCACAALLCVSLVITANNVNADITFGITGGVGASANFNLMPGEIDEGRFRAGTPSSGGTPFTPAGGTGLTRTMSFGVYVTGYDSFSITSYEDYPLDNLFAGLGLTSNTANGFTGSVADFGSLMDDAGYLWFTGTWNLPGGPLAPSDWVSNMPSGFTFGLFNAEGGGDPVPEPATLAIIGLGLVGLGWVRRRRK